MTRTLLITRPADDARRLATEIRQIDPELVPVVAPVLEIVPVAFEPPGEDYELTILTSRHAAQAAAEHFPDLTAWCVGAATAAAGEALGLATWSVDGTVEDLLAALAPRKGARVLHLHGAHSRGALTQRLRAAGVRADDCVVYAQEERPWSPQERAEIAHAARMGEVIVPLYSPRSARLLGRRLRDLGIGETLTLVAISSSCLEAWSGPAPRRALVAAAPNAEAMKAALATLRG
ncbi:uroporphyrinogen-III synthase [Celeribacter indicus]|uniref:Uroporphyrinogen-III synthase n=1 Tax=Celeribacter indicus TaxID=1208324 RepID=A0A0B5DMI7_9RHOB|nr:uroporphyrinogen-III synthase [Celeribacter indicus]AJE44858.1 uroporphyrinogen-III synthase [Celeribacter indicus]SDX23370.1 uroporphyrinogen-III synthase [Celeribacter indicus]